MKKVLLIAVTLGIFMVAGIYFVADRVFPAPDEKLLVLEGRLGGKDLVLLGHVNLRAIGNYQRYFLRSASEAGSGINRNLRGNLVLDKLESSGLLLGQEVTDVVASVHQDKGIYRAGLLIMGNFSRKDVARFLRKELNAIEKGTDQWLIGKTDARNCTVQADYQIHLSEGLVIISRPDDMEWLRARLAAANVDPDELQTWRDYRSNKIAALMVKEIDSLSFLPLPEAVRMKLRAVIGTDSLDGAVSKKKTSRSRESVWLGLSPQLLPPGGRFELQLFAADQDLVASRFTAGSDALGKLAQQIPDTLPVLQALVNRIELRASGDSLTVNLMFDFSQRHQLGQLLTEAADYFMASLLPERDPAGVVSVPSETVAGEVVAGEVVVEHPQQFLAVYDAATIVDYQVGLSESGYVSGSNGPAAVMVERLGVDDDGMVNIGLKFELQNVQNLGIQQAMVKDVRVLDKNGSDMLPILPCGQHENQQPLLLTETGNRIPGIKESTTPVLEVSGSRNFQLNDYGKAENVGRINAVFEVDVPVETTTLRIPVPAQGRVVEFGKGRVYIEQAAGSTVDYRVSGERSGLVVIRGLNSAGKVLADAGSAVVALSGFPGVHVTSRYQGSLAAIEVVTVNKSRLLRYEVAVGDAFALRENPAIVLSEGKAIPVVSKKELVRLTKMQAPAALPGQAASSLRTETGPLEMAWDGFSLVGQSASVQLSYRSPLIDSATNNLSALELEATLYDKAGQPLEGGVLRAFLPVKPASGLMAGSQLLEWPALKAANPDVGFIKGRVVFWFPQEIVPVDIDKFEMGEGWILGGNAEIRYEILQPGSQPMMQFSVKGDQHQLLQLQLLDENKWLVADAVPQQRAWMKGDGSRLLEFAIRKYPKLLRVLFGNKMEPASYSFEIALPAQ